MRGNDVLQASPDIMVTDSLTGNIMGGEDAFFFHNRWKL